MRSIRILTFTLLAMVLSLSATAQNLDISGWTLEQTDSAQSFTIPAGTSVAPGAYVIICRDVDRAAFETYYGVTLAPDVVYLRSSNSAPMINGAETYSLLDAASALQDGPTDAVTTTRRSYHRADPETQAFTVIDEIPSPASGVEAPDTVMSGLVISEVTDPLDYVYEYVELYYDATIGGGGNLAPVITNVQHSPASPVNGDDVTVSCTVTDADGAVDVVWVWSRTDAGSFLPTAMTATGGGVYSHTFPSMSGGLELQYYMWARDNEAAESLNPLGAPSSWYSVFIGTGVVGGKVVLFDHAHAQDAGSGGNWRVDDNHPTPVPDTPTSEASWSGQLSSWGYELWQAGHTIRSNTGPFSAALLADVDLVVCVEPQDPFTAAEIEALRQFVFTGGAFFFVANHNASDRNSNGWDSPSIFGGFSVPHITNPVGSDTETFCGANYGIHCNVKDEGNNSITGTYTNVLSDPTNPVLHGPYGDVGAVIFHVGNGMSLWPTVNGDLSDVGALISTDSGAAAVAAWSRHGNGKVVGYGDSSSTGDGTDSETHADNWTEAGSNNREFFLNASAWLLTPTGTAVGDVPLNPGHDLHAAPNPFNPSTRVSFTMPADGAVRLTVHDLQGRLVRTLVDGVRNAGEHSIVFDGRDMAGRSLASGVYLVRAQGTGMVSWTKVVLSK